MHKEKAPPDSRVYASLFGFSVLLIIWGLILGEPRRLLVLATHVRATQVIGVAIGHVLRLAATAQGDAVPLFVHLAVRALNRDTAAHPQGPANTAGAVLHQAYLLRQLLF